MLSQVELRFLVKIEPVCSLFPYLLILAVELPLYGSDIIGKSTCSGLSIGEGTIHGLVVSWGKTWWECGRGLCISQVKREGI